MATADLTAQRLRELLEYNPETGHFVRRIPVKGGCGVGNIAGSLSKKLGYIAINIDGVKFYAHRLVWLYVHGTWPNHQIDHINGVRDDNRLVNLRDVTQQVNIQNRTAVISSSGFIGVHWAPRSRKWCAQLRANGVRHYLGLHATAEDAAQAYRAAKELLLSHRSPS